MKICKVALDMSDSVLVIIEFNSYSFSTARWILYIRLNKYHIWKQISFLFSIEITIFDLHFMYVSTLASEMYLIFKQMVIFIIFIFFCKSANVLNKSNKMQKYNFTHK